MLKKAEQHGYGIDSLPDPIKTEEGRKKWDSKIKVIGFELIPVNEIVLQPKQNQPRQDTKDTEHVQYLDNLIHSPGSKLLKPITTKLDDVNGRESTKRILLGGHHRLETYKNRGKESIASWVLKFTSVEWEIDYTAADSRHIENGKQLSDGCLLRYLRRLKGNGFFNNLGKEKTRKNATDKLRNYGPSRTDKARGKLVTQFVNEIYPPQLEKKTMSEWKNRQKKSWEKSGFDKKIGEIYNNELNLFFQTHAVHATIGSIMLHSKNKLIEFKGEGYSDEEAKKMVEKISLEIYGVITGTNKLGTRKTAIKDLTQYQKLGMLPMVIKTIIFKRQDNDGNENEDVYYDWDKNKKEFIQRGT